MLSRLLNFFLPPECALCREPVTEAHTLCIHCFTELDFIPDPICDDCGFPLPNTEFLRCMSCISKEPPFKKAQSALVYDEASKGMILKFKHCDRLDLAKPLARLMYLKVKDLIIRADVIIPVPLHRKRLWKRRYNQATLIARELKFLLKEKDQHTIPVLTNVLARKKETAPQGASFKARYSNVQRAFSVKDAHKLKDKSVALIDDVYTTGATVKACTRTLKKAGAREVYVITAARVIRGDDILI